MTATPADVHARRSSSQHRMSTSGNAAASIPIRQSHSKNHSHSLSTGSINQTHRVTRRKSMSSNASNLAAMAAAVQDSGDGLLASSVPSHRRSMPSKRSSSGVRGLEGLASRVSNYPSPPSSLAPGYEPATTIDSAIDSASSALVDGPALSPLDSPESLAANKARVRRASEGSHLVKTEGRRVASGELRCDQCGKGYKHSSCLTKHLWEHTPEWSLTSKLLISKHQQVQLLEAASVLVQMNTDGPTPPESAKDLHSDQHSSASPAASGSSDLHDDDEEMSSTDTTPPPQTEDSSSMPISAGKSRANKKRYSSNSTGFSRSYQSAPLGPFFNGSAPSDTSGFQDYKRQSGDWQSTYSGDANEVDDAGLAAAVGLLSCSYGTPRSGPVILPPDVPPVPPLPARFLSTNGSSNVPDSKNSAINPHEQTTAFMPESTKVLGVHRDESGESAVDDEDYYDQRSARGRSDEDDDGVFGRMEE